ncbi:LLM class oxidoreductase [Burkholderia stabilis]|uniref:TIGR03571 family LLM class oxidoreductase n=1 Tax=Burkholderia stabilis TaxID=95485 RepID=UPI00085217CB|nr:TIGR03571 family LLM class oxidoreductase [Burkholderia stabilis]AOR72114.1 LLM class oxidoreductase [Burkholderia stabilis]HDR9488841.1 TIGR03571 family LLM class oxidoreductase [Burkholderia stabilis]HDR9521100.1 TIGR03571 family LLM class oxidoreductase [Burkholderia stabilis]HDR9528851.1 TIGR03571 family LLM class oxidoreductase [Burkholderia stabilis]HDR9536847.1 TIGR03571 family LLM class oxidoreductase [Burkholderia stabilis]
MTTPAPARPDIAHRIFSDERLSIGLTLPLLRSGNVVADFNEQLELAALADALGFRALWIRDVPLNSADYPDPVGHLDPWVFLGALAARTRRIALASGAIVLPLRHPLHIAKGALSVATLSGGRFILGLGSGDRPPEYAAFGVDAQTRRDRYREHWDVVAAALGVPSRVLPDEAPPDAPEFTLLPRGDDAVPMLAVGSGGQSVDWIARHSIGWMTYHRDPDTQRARYSMWRAAVERLASPAFRAFGVSMRLDLAAHPDAPAAALPLGYATGRHALIDILRDMHAAGTHHVTLNLGSDRPVRDVIEEIATHVLPVFHDRPA